MSLSDLEREVGEQGEMLKAHEQRLGRIEKCLDSKDGGIAQAVLQIAADMSKSRNAGMVTLSASILALMGVIATALLK